MKNKRNNGITLIALVVTIIVLLILAGISIAMLSGNNGILQRATEAKEYSERATIIENAKIDVLSKITENKGNDLQESQLKDVLKKYFINSEIPEELPNDLSTLKLTTLNNNYKIKVSEIYDGSFKKVNISTGKSVSDIYDGVNNPDEQNYNENAMHIGDWVEYDAGNWTETKEVPDWETTPLSFGGYTSGQSRNTNASGIESSEGEKYEGWRIFDISGNTITLISAGCPEGYWDIGSKGYNTEIIFTGETTGTIDSTYPSTPRDWSIYENQYANNNTARSIKKSDLDNWYNKYIDSMINDLSDIDKIENGWWDEVNQIYNDPRGIPSNSENKLISVMSNRFQYLLTTFATWGQYTSYSYSWAKWADESTMVGINDGEDDGVYGVRILVTLKNDIKFNETPTKLQKDGYSYNKWTISEN